MQRPLADLTVIVTRPLAQARPWSEKLARLGADSQLLPVLEIVPLAEGRERQAIVDTILALDTFQKVIFVSQNAVNEAVAWVDHYWPQRPIGIDYFAVGETTAKVATDQGFEVSAGERAMNSEALLALPALQDVAGERIVIFRGVGGRGLLAAELQQRGAAVTYCELYRRRRPADAEAAFRQVSLANTTGDRVISVHSGESLENLVTILAAADQTGLQQLPLLVPGRRVAALAREWGFSHCIVARNATDRAMTQALVDWRGHHDR